MDQKQFGYTNVLAGEFSHLSPLLVAGNVSRNVPAKRSVQRWLRMPTP